MANRPEVKAIRSNLSVLVNSIATADNGQDVVMGLVEQAFISSENAFAAPGVSFSERVGKMISAVQNNIKTAEDPKERFENFIQIVDNVPGNTAQKVRETYKNLQENGAGISTGTSAAAAENLQGSALPQGKGAGVSIGTPTTAAESDGFFSKHKTTPASKPRLQADSGEVPCYPMSKKPHGGAFIVNNVHFDPRPDNKQLRTRDGSNADRDNLRSALIGLGYTVQVRDDLKGDEIERWFDDICEMDHTNRDSIVCCLLSHGKEGAIIGKDNKPVKIRDISKKLARCDQLVGKPKIFFVQACQGSHRPEELQRDDDKYDPDKDIASLPRDSDFFFGYATTPETISLRYETTGTWYIGELCQVLGENKHDLVTMVTLVHHAVATKNEYRYEIEIGTNKFYRQQPQLVSTLRHQVKF